MARISRDDVIAAVQLGGLFARIFGRGKAQRVDLIGYAADAIEAYDNLRGIGDRIEQAAAGRTVYSCNSVEETELLAAVVRSVRRAAQVIKRR